MKGMSFVVGVDHVVPNPVQELSYAQRLKQGVARDIQRTHYLRRKAQGKENICMKCEGDIGPERRAEEPEAVVCTTCVMAVRSKQ